MSDENTDVANADLAKTELAKRIRLLTAAVGNNLGRVQDGVFFLVTENETDYFLDQRMKEFEANMKALHAYALELAKVRGYQSAEAAAKIALRNEGFSKAAARRVRSAK